MIRACHVDVQRIGLGNFRSCFVSGNASQVIVRCYDNLQIAAFFEGYPHGEALEDELDAIVQQSAVA